jgi:limonene-1,2-epoxide hydrolase
LISEVPVTQPVDVVREFCTLMERRQPEAMRPFIAEDAVYQNVGMPASVGVDAIVENLEAQFAMLPAAYAYEILNIASDGSVVMTERLDYIQAPDCRKPRYSRHGHIRCRRRLQDPPSFARAEPL